MDPSQQDTGRLLEKISAMTPDERRDAALSYSNLQSALYEALDCDAWIVDFGPDWVVFETWDCGDGGFDLLKVGYSIDGLDVTLEGEPESVISQTSWETVSDRALAWAYAMAARAKYSQDEIDELGAKGQAFKNPDGHYSYPIADKEDLSNAIRAVGRGNADHDAIRKYIIRRAKALGEQDEIPDNWNADGSLAEENDGDPTGANADDGSTGGSTGAPAGVADATGSASSDEPHEERDDEPAEEREAGTDDETAPEEEPETEAEPEACSCKSRGGRRYKGRHSSAAPPPRGELRVVATDLEVSSGSGHDIVLDGSPIVYNVDYQVHDAFGAFTERMSPGVCDGVLDRSSLDCKFLYNHDGMVLARTSSGTLELANTSRALTCRAHLDDRSTLANDLAVAVERGDVSQMSIGFITAQDEWNSDFTDRTVTRLADLLDVSAVSFPASPTTSIGLAERALFKMSREARHEVRKSYGLACDVREGATLDSACADGIVGALERLYVLDDPSIPVVRVRAAFRVMRDVRAGKTLSAANASFIQAAIASLARADDVDLPEIVESLRSVDDALDEAQEALAGVAGVPGPEEDDAEAREDEAAEETAEAEPAEGPSHEDLRRSAEAARARLEHVKRRRRR